MTAINRSRISLLAMTMSVAGPGFAQQCTSTSAQLTFSEFPVGTTITTQYQDKGFNFPASPAAQIASDSSNPTSPVLSGMPKFQGPIVAELVDPSNPATKLAATSLSFQAGYFDQVASTVVEFRDINGAVLSTESNQSTGIVTFTAPAGTHSFQIADAGGDQNGFAIDNLQFTAQSGGALRISIPNKDAEFVLNQQNQTRSEDISFTAAGSAATGAVNWTAELEYDTSTPRSMPGLTSTFTTNGTATHKLYYQSRGGRLKVAASTSAAQACPVEYVYILGSQIPDDTITTRLVSLYADGPTPRLYTGIANQESNYRQFTQITKYGHAGLWPTESYDGGSHVGLMQVASSGSTITGSQGVFNAWSWIENTASADTLFREKMRTAVRLYRRMRTAAPGIRELTGVELESMAITLYGPGAASGLENQYYRAVNTDGSWNWVVNTQNNPTGVNYTNEVRSKIQ
ncbi:hypothetical protein FHY16_000704 [Xanthomonas campestris]|uniref:hypothetical protein n=1 Tax=Xanthomonas euroxanthea TaxID=2259622 RepID=UPI0017ECEB90|nr:hypothetical protein [Xanthomonas euroxanthea]MBB3777983.1 hypothetical protein [Xanthomonas euroxanthea]